jgi:hypothetical protein
MPRRKARPGVENAAVGAERRAGQRHWPVIPGDLGIGPTAGGPPGAALRPAPVGVPLPSHGVGETDWTDPGAKTRRENEALGHMEKGTPPPGKCEWKMNLSPLWSD